MASNELNIPEDGIGLCLSGGGFRATLFHIGVLWRLNEFGYLPKLKRISSVSGGSIATGWLGLNWKKLDFDKNGVAGNFIETFVNPLRAFTSKNLDAWIIIFGLLNPFSSISEMLIQSYRKNLFGNATLQDLPNAPDFVFNASNAQTGVLFRFSKRYIADYLIGMMNNPAIELAAAVAASSAFPPFLSPVQLNLDGTSFTPDPKAVLQKEPFTSNVILLDGGVYDNLGLEPIQKNYNTILVSDAGGKMQPDPRPKFFWGIQAYRVLNMMDNQVRSLRKRQIVDMFKLRVELLNYTREHQMGMDENILKRVSRKGAYWGTFVDIEDYALGDNVLNCPYEKTQELANLPTRLRKFSSQHQERLINWGYAICDAAMRKFVDPNLPNNAKFPYPGGVG
jgi:NTE family protein